jgi:hypothetical protein
MKVGNRLVVTLAFHRCRHERPPDAVKMFSVILAEQNVHDVAIHCSDR